MTLFEKLDAKPGSAEEHDAKPASTTNSRRVPFPQFILICQRINSSVLKLTQPDCSDSVSHFYIPGLSKFQNDHYVSSPTSRQGQQGFNPVPCSQQSKASLVLREQTSSSPVLLGFGYNRSNASHSHSRGQIQSISRSGCRPCVLSSGW